MYKYLFIYIFKYSSSPRGHVNPAGPGNPVCLGSISWTVSSTNWDGYGKEMIDHPISSSDLSHHLFRIFKELQ